MKYEELVAELRAGKTLESLLDLTQGQNCFIYKAKGKCFDLNEVIYIPDVSLNDIPTDYVMSKDDLAECSAYFYTWKDFLDLCKTEDKALELFDLCDWANPWTVLDEMERENQEDDIKERWFAETRWCTDDIIGIAKDNGIEMTPQQAEQWWKKNENWFKNALVEYGNEVLANADFSEV